MVGLREDQLAFYLDQGYLLLENAFDPSLLDLLKREFDQRI